ncbi:MAG: UDP-3-O-(3-hydroxymyristoyl)glucosamine N-acyltransferase [Deltaproteobacteria bacterium]|nr:MAG: UDP-3-O-(3-hydroxymyristoyl)glucosamine N-acyltransferase [Deltaproteobacteria bacterium]
MKRNLGELARLVDGEFQGDEHLTITGVAGLEEAQQTDISFVIGPKHARQADRSRAGALIVPPGLRDMQRPLIVSENPYLAFAKILTSFADEQRPVLGVSPDAYLGSEVKVGSEVSIHPQVYLGDHSVVGDRVTLYPKVYVGAGVHIGDDTVVYPNVTILDRCIIGKNVILHSGAVVGSDGFGFAQDGRRHFKIPQVGIVQIDDEVEIGANTTVDRATMGKTWIQRGTKIDNLVQVAHNVVVGEDTIIVAQVGISGSVRIGKNVILAGQVGVAGHLEIGDGVRVGAQSGIPKSIPPGQAVTGSPAIAHRTFLRQVQFIQRLPELSKRVKDLEQRLEAMEKATDS